MGRSLKWKPFLIFSLPVLHGSGFACWNRGTGISNTDDEIAQVHYSGGGDWYGDATVIKNWLRLLRTRTDIETAEDRVIIKLTDHTLYQYPDALPSSDTEIFGSRKAKLRRCESIS